MAEMKAARRSEFTSPTPAAPVLVGFNGNDGGRDALELARLLAAIRGCGCVVAAPDAEHFGAEARAALDDPEAAVKTIGVVSPARMLSHCATHEQAGTLVVGASRQSRIGRALLGSVGAQVLRSAGCEVAVAPRGYADERHDDLSKIAVAVDGTPESKIALTRAEDLARQAGATVEVLVSEDPVVSDIEAEFPPGAPSSMSDVLEAAVGAVDPALSPTGKKVDPGWKQVTRTIAAGLAAACEPDVDLLVSGCRRPLEHFFAGSVTQNLIVAAPCPVLVVPHSREV